MLNSSKYHKIQTPIVQFGANEGEGKRQTKIKILTQTEQTNKQSSSTDTVKSIDSILTEPISQYHWENKDFQFFSLLQSHIIHFNLVMTETMFAYNSHWQIIVEISPPTASTSSSFHYIFSIPSLFLPFPHNYVPPIFPPFDSEFSSPLFIIITSHWNHSKYETTDPNHSKSLTETQKYKGRKSMFENRYCQSIFEFLL